ncbi:MAG: FecR domain-containing protein [Pseudomonadota bacterium]
MISRSDITVDSEITTEACAWVAQVESGNMSGADLAALREWMGRSSAHRQEIRQIAEISGQLAILTELASAIEANAGVGHGARRTTARKAFAAPAFMAVLALIVGGIALFTMQRSGVHAMPEIYKTAVGEYQTVSLSDGTSVSLNTASQIEVDFNDEERRVRMIEGEALFDVASNPKRPFVVYSDNAVAEAVGTSFVVRLRNTLTELAVVEGVVAFSRLPQSINLAAPDDVLEAAPNEQPLDQVIVRAGQTLTSGEISTHSAISEAPDIPSLTERDLQRKLSWTEGFLEFSDTPLEEVVGELTRHNPISIDILEPDLRELKFGGIFRTGDVDQLLAALEGLGVDVERVDDDHFVLRTAGSQ